MRRLLAIMVSVVLAVSTLVGCGDKENANGQNLKNTSNNTSSNTQKEEGNSELTLGSFEADGYQLNVAAGTFEKGADVKVQAIADAELPKYENSEKYKIIGNPLKISSESYKGDIFGTDVELTLPIPGDRPENYVVLYWDENGEVRYFQPSSFDIEKGTMTVSLPHFSLFGSGELTDEEKIEHFLNQYAAKEAVAREEDKKAASELEPYIKAKIDALQLSEEAGSQLTLSVINYVAGEIDEDAGEYTEIATSAYTSIEKGDPADFEGKIEGIISEKLYDILNYNVATGKADLCFKDVGKTGTILGAIAGGDTETALKEIGDVIGDVVPEIGVTTKAAGYVGAKVNECFTNWKSNQIEELYQIYKNGAEDVWGNEVIAGDEESLKNYIHTGSGFTLAKGVYRFYNMDKVAETCEKYGWGKKDYEELDEKYRAEFDRRAEEGLMNYFKKRLAQERVAEEIKQEERACIEEMLNEYYGALDSKFYRGFFGEQSSDDYNLTNRLERLVNVRRYISQYVDEEKLKKTEDYNYGTLLNMWVMYASENKKSEAIDQFINFLQEEGLLNSAYANHLSMNEMAGTYTGMSFKAIRVSQEVYEAYISEYGSDGATSRAQCDEAIAEQIAESGMTGIIDNTFSLEANKNDPSIGVVKTIVHGDDGDYTATAKVELDGEKMIVYNDEGSTEATVVKGKDGKYAIKGDMITLDLQVNDEGSSYLLFVDVQIDAVKNE